MRAVRFTFYIAVVLAIVYFSTRHFGYGGKHSPRPFDLTTTFKLPPEPASLVFLNDTHVLVGSDRVLLMWNVAAKQPGDRLSGSAAAFSDDRSYGVYLVNVGEHSLSLSHPRHEQDRGYPILVDERQRLPLETPASLVAMSPDGQTIAAAIGAEVKLWNFETRQELQTFVHNGAVVDVSFSKDGRSLLVVFIKSADVAVPKNGLMVWDVATRAATLNLIAADDQAFSAAALHPNGAVIATAGEDTSIKLRDLATGELKHQLTEHTARTTCLAYSPDGHSLISGDARGNVNLWDIDKNGVIKTLDDSTHVPPLTVVAVAFAPNGAFAAARYSDGTVKIWALR